MRAEAFVKIRRARRCDAVAIERLVRGSFREHEPAYTPEAFDLATPRKREIETRIKNWIVWVAVEQNEIVGTVSVYEKGSGLHVRSMAVHPSMRGQGIGELLLKRIEDFARGNGYKCLFLNTTPFMNSAIRLYERFGFVFTGAEQDWFGTRLRSMTKHLTSGSSKN